MSDGTSTPAWYLGLPAVVTVDATDGAVDGELRLLRTSDLVVADGLTRQGRPAAACRARVVPADGAPARRGPFRRVRTASAVRIGPVMVALDNHVPVEYGLRAGLLRLQDEPGRDRVRVDLEAGEEFRVACAVADAPAAPPPAGMQRVIYGWFLGMPLIHNVTLPTFYGGTAPAEPDPDTPVTRTYLTAPVDMAAPASPVRQVPTADGPRTMMSHQNTTDVHPGATPHATYGFFVVVGPKGSDDTVVSTPAPPDGLPPHPLASALRVRDRWVPLSNHLVIEYGVATGHLALVPLEYGGTLTTSLPGDTQIRASTTPTGLVPVDGVERTTVGTLSIRHADIELMGSRDNSAVPDGARALEVTADRLAFAPGEIRVRVGEPVAVRLHAADVMHTFVVDDLGVYIQADAASTGEGGFVAERPGTYEYYCSLMAHRAAGMTGRLVVEP